MAKGEVKVNKGEILYMATGGIRLNKGEIAVVKYG